MQSYTNKSFNVCLIKIYKYISSIKARVFFAFSYRYDKLLKQEIPPHERERKRETVTTKSLCRYLHDKSYLSLYDIFWRHFTNYQQSTNVANGISQTQKRAEKNLMHSFFKWFGSRAWLTWLAAHRRFSYTIGFYGRIFIYWLTRFKFDHVQIIPTTRIFCATSTAQNLRTAFSRTGQIAIRRDILSRRAAERDNSIISINPGVHDMSQLDPVITSNINSILSMSRININSKIFGNISVQIATLSRNIN